MGVNVNVSGDALANKHPLGSVHSLFKPEFTYLVDAKRTSQQADEHIRVNDVIEGTFLFPNTIHNEQQSPAHLPLGTASHALEQLGLFGLRGAKSLSALEVSLKRVGDITYSAEISRLCPETAALVPIKGELALTSISCVDKDIYVTANCRFDNLFLANRDVKPSLQFRGVEYVLRPISPVPSNVVAFSENTVQYDESIIHSSPEVTPVREMYRERFASLVDATFLRNAQQISKYIDEGPLCEGVFRVQDTYYASTPSHVTQGMAADMLEQLGMFAFTSVVRRQLLPIANPAEYALSILCKERARVSSISGLEIASDLSSDALIFGGMNLVRVSIGRDRAILRAKLALDHKYSTIYDWSSGDSQAKPALAVKEAVYVLDYTPNLSIYSHTNGFNSGLSQ